jgi:FkbM family methyltransferase
MNIYATSYSIEGIIKNCLRRLKKAFMLTFMPSIVAVKKQFVRIDSLYKSMQSSYNFSYKDINLYATEKFVKMNAIASEPADEDGLMKVEIGDRSIFWPSVVPIKNLPWLFHEIFDPFEYNPSSYDNPILDLHSRSWVIDAGAAEGYFSLFALEHSIKKILCVEPLSIMRSALKRTLDMHVRESTAIVITAALGSAVGSTEILINYDNLCDAFVQTIVANKSAKNIFSSTGSSNTEIEVDAIECVSVTTIDQLAKSYDLGKKGLIKMDIEGFEMEALRGAENLLKEHKPALAIAVYHNIENANECAQIIKAANSEYVIEFRGFYGYFDPPRPYILFAI